MLKVGDLGRRIHYDTSAIGGIVAFRVFVGPRGTKFRKALVMWSPTCDIFSCSPESILPINS